MRNAAKNFDILAIWTFYKIYFDIVWQNFLIYIQLKF